MSARRRGTKWYVDFSFRGQRFRLKSPEDSSNGAKAYEAVLRQRLAKGEDILKLATPSPLFADFADKWIRTYVKSNNKYSELITKQSAFNAHILPFFGRLSLEQITVYKVEQFKAHLLNKDLSPKTINNIISALRKCLNTAQAWDLLVKVPKIDLLKVPPQKFRYLSFEESELLLNNTDGIWHDMFLLAMRTGLRFGEIIALEWSDINFATSQMTVCHSISRGILGSTKSNKIRYLPILDSVMEMLKNRPKTDQYVFSLGDNKPMKQIYCIKNLNRICRQLNIRKINWHMFRHTFASHLANRNISLQVIQHLLGHSDIRTTMRYAHLSPETLKESIQVLDQKIDPCHSSVTKTDSIEIINIPTDYDSPNLKQKQTSLSVNVL
jgi:integrase